MMKKYEKLKKLSDKNFKKAIGIPRLLFEIYILVITEALEIKHKKVEENQNYLLKIFYF